MIYIIAEDPDVGPVKIGYASGVPFEGNWKRALQARMTDLQAGNWRPLFIIGLCDGTIVQERALHALFADLRIRGEWFRREGAVEQFLSENRISPVGFFSGVGLDEKRPPKDASQLNLQIAKRIAKAFSEHGRLKRAARSMVGRGRKPYRCSLCKSPEHTARNHGKEVALGD